MPPTRYIHIEGVLLVHSDIRIYFISSGKFLSAFSIFMEERKYMIVLTIKNEREMHKVKFRFGY